MTFRDRLFAASEDAERLGHAVRWDSVDYHSGIAKGRCAVCGTAVEASRREGGVRLFRSACLGRLVVAAQRRSEDAARPDRRH